MKWLYGQLQPFSKFSTGDRLFCRNVPIGSTGTDSFIEGHLSDPRILPIGLIGSVKNQAECCHASSDHGLNNGNLQISGLLGLLCGSTVHSETRGLYCTLPWPAQCLKILQVCFTHVSETCIKIYKNKIQKCYASFSFSMQFQIKSKL